MATAGMDRSLKIWDVRNTYACLGDYKLSGSTGASHIEVQHLNNGHSVRMVLTAQWGSEIWTSLNFEWVANGPDFKWDLKSGSLTI